MDEVGNILREAREAHGWTVEQVQSNLKIQSRYLTALEEGRYEVLPTPVHVRGYLRNYAKILQLDPQPLLDSYQANLHSRGGRVVRVDSAETLIPDPANNPFFNPVNVELNPDQVAPNSESLLRIIVIVALLIAIGLVASRFFVESGENARSVSLGEVFETFTSEGAPSVAELDVDAIVENAEVSVENDILIETGRTELTNEEIPTPIPDIPLLTDLEIINITLELTERAWVDILVDGERQFRGQARSGEVFEYTAEDNVTVNTGNAFAIFVTINDNALGRLGERQEAIEYSWDTTQ